MGAPVAAALVAGPPVAGPGGGAAFPHAWAAFPHAAAPAVGAVVVAMVRPLPPLSHGPWLPLRGVAVRAGPPPLWAALPSRLVRSWLVAPRLRRL